MTNDTRVTLHQTKLTDQTQAPILKNTQQFSQTISWKRTTTCSTKQMEILKRLKNKTSLPKNAKIGGIPTGKTYPMRSDPKEVLLDDPKERKKLLERKIRDTKSGGLSWSSRVRGHPKNIR